MAQLKKVEDLRRSVSAQIAQKKKSQLGQFMTPSSVAQFMANLFPLPKSKQCKLLEPGAGVGALACAFLDRWVAGDLQFEQVEAFAYEIDDDLREHLSKHLNGYQGLKLHVFSGDFVELAAKDITLGAGGFTHAILNPPYKKINSASQHRLALRSAGIETVNLYSAFLALAVGLMAEGGQVVAIVPRSFCNGPYYKPFREYILERAAVVHMHLFESRNKAFKDDDVLQENLIIRLERGGHQGPVTVSCSTDDTFSDLTSHQHPFDRIVLPTDAERFIHVPTSPEVSALEMFTCVRHSLADLGITVSTGPVVDFRLKEHLRSEPELEAVPLLYPAHFGPKGVVWPRRDIKKSNAILRNSSTERWLYPTGTYCVVKRFSSKEERRRVVARVVTPAAFGAAPMLGFENHLNVFHCKKQELPQALAYGLTAFLNTTAVDDTFRRFNGHTQVNATDLKQMKYPSRELLEELGQWAMQHDSTTQDELDEAFVSIVKPG